MAVTIMNMERALLDIEELTNEIKGVVGQLMRCSRQVQGLKRPTASLQDRVEDLVC